MAVYNNITLNNILRAIMQFDCWITALKCK